MIMLTVSMLRIVEIVDARFEFGDDRPLNLDRGGIVTVASYFDHKAKAFLPHAGSIEDNKVANLEDRIVRICLSLSAS